MNANKSWASLSTVNKEEFNKRAADRKIPTFAELSDEGQRQKVHETRKKIEALVSCWFTRSQTAFVCLTCPSTYM